MIGKLYYSEYKSGNEVLNSTTNTYWGWLPVMIIDTSLDRFSFLAAINHKLNEKKLYMKIDGLSDFRTFIVGGTVSEYPRLALNTKYWIPVYFIDTLDREWKGYNI